MSPVSSVAALVNHLRRLAKPKGTYPEGTTLRHSDGRRYRVDKRGQWRRITKPPTPARLRKARAAHGRGLSRPLAA